jgi:hypothetical protein
MTSPSDSGANRLPDLAPLERLRLAQLQAEEAKTAGDPDDAPLLHGELLKTIGLLNIIGAQGGLKPTPSILKLCYTSPQKGVRIGPLTVDVRKRFDNEPSVWK